MGRYEDLIDTLYALHSESDDARRDALLDRAVADDVEFYGIQNAVVGRQDFASAFRNGGTYLVRTSAVEQHHGWIRCTWELRMPDGTVAATDDGRPYAGLQVSQLAPDGRLRCIVPFLGKDVGATS